MNWPISKISLESYVESLVGVFLLRCLPHLDPRTGGSFGPQWSIALLYCYEESERLINLEAKAR